jgi:hypothetical protein
MTVSQIDVAATSKRLGVQPEYLKRCLRRGCPYGLALRLSRMTGIGVGEFTGGHQSARQSQSKTTTSRRVSQKPEKREATRERGGVEA